MGDVLFEKLADRVGEDISEVEDSLSLEDLMSLSDLGDAIQLVDRYAADLPDELQHQLSEHHADFENLIQIRNRVMHARPLEFDDLARTTDLTERLVKSPSFWGHLAEMVANLKAAPETVLTLTIPYESDPGAPYNNLPLPDFDETGFIGRHETVENAKRAVLGVYPVVTIVGEGGLGKTSLALKVAYDLLESNLGTFDAIIFVSAKTAQLTGPEITRIRGAINTSIGLFEAAVRIVDSSDEVSDPLNDLIELLKEFKTLLIIDNLETVIDENMRVLLSSLPAGSKILITTRIRFGAFEFPVQLESMSEREAVKLLRTTAKVRGCEKLVQASDKVISKFCSRMRNNPLHIKWFVSAVQAGQRPEQVLADEKVFLQFCLANVFSQVSENAKTLVRTLLALGGRYTVAELSYLTDLNHATLLNAIQELMRTNMFFSTSMPTAVSFETKYELSQLARAYLTRFYPVSKDTQKMMLKAKQRLVSAGEQIASEALSNPLSAGSIHCRSRSDWVIARYLRDALSKIRVGDFEAALELVGKAQGLAPDFSEVYRVEAWAYAKSGNLSQAYDSYSKSVELASDSAIAYFLFGGFLLRDMHDSERASEMFKKAHELCPDRPEPKIELARCYLYVRDFDRAEKIIGELELSNLIDEYVKLKICDLHLQLYTRRADRYCTEQQYFSCKKSLLRTREYYLTISHPDRRMRERLAKLLYLRAPLMAHWETEPVERAEVEQFFVWLDEVLFEDRELVSVSNGGAQPKLQLSNEGYIAKLHESGRFGFIRQDDGGDLYFRIGEYRRRFSEDVPRVGIRVRFEVKFDWKGRIVATNVRGA